MNGYLLAGMVTGIVVALVIAWVGLRFTKKDKKEKFTYDERQKAARGEAYKYAFFTMIIYNAAYGLLDLAGIIWAETMTGLMIGVCIAILVHVSYSIWNECYFSMNEEPKRVLVFFGVISVINTVIAVMQGLDGELIENGMLTNNCANLVVAVMFGVIMIVLAAKWMTKNNELEED
jgi:hypothetical protein